MADNIKYPEHMVFGLDIGTRSIVGSVGYMDKGKFNVVAHHVKEHETRAMLDGQIHDIAKVGETIAMVRKELEAQIGRNLNEVCIAAAGRVLKTVTVSVSTDRIDDTAITDEEIYSLDLLGVERAYEIMRNDFPDIDFYCVGYTAVKYYMNEYVINNLEGHKAKKIGADILATFLPHEVVEGLYSAVETAGLHVSNLTLEPIAAINVAIPEQFRLLNIALVDVGAGTSDICITKDGSIVAYGMIPHAGDEITETIVHNYLVDFQTAEKIKRASLAKRQITYKDIMGLSHKISPEDVRAIYKSTVESMTGEIADKIKELNGGKSVSAVFIVGGGGKVTGFTDSLANALEIQSDRVALRGEEVLGSVNFLMDGVKKDPLLVTPIGICINYYNQKNNFIIVTVNEQRIKLYDNDKLTVVDGVMQAGLSNLDLFPKRGAELNFTLNGNPKIIRGELGDAAVITVNGREANLNTKISKNDKITIIPSVEGKKAAYTVEQLSEYRNTLKFIVNDKIVECPKVALANAELVTGSYQIKENDVINIPDHYMLSQLLQYMDIEPDGKKIMINGHISAQDEPVYGDFNVTITEDNDSSKDNTHTENDILNEENENSEKVSVAKSDTVNDGIDENMKKTLPEMGQSTIQNEKAKPADTGMDIVVVVNRTPVVLKNKKKYVFVDILDVYPFDTKTAGGTELIMTINGENCTFSQEIKDGDILELYWKP